MRCIYRRELGLIDDEQWQRFERKQGNMVAEKGRLASVRVRPDDPVAIESMELSKNNVSQVCIPNQVLACIQLFWMLQR